jgi:hypothetical protein
MKTFFEFDNGLFCTVSILPSFDDMEDKEIMIYETMCNMLDAGAYIPVLLERIEKMFDVVFLDSNKDVFKLSIKQKERRVQVAKNKVHQVRKVNRLGNPVIKQTKKNEDIGYLTFQRSDETEKQAEYRMLQRYGLEHLYVSSNIVSH